MTSDGSEGATIEARLSVERRKLEAVRELGQVLGATLELDRLLEALLGKVTELLDAERATIFLVDSDARTLRSTFVEGGVIEPIRLAIGEGIAGWVAQTGATLNLPDAYADPRFLRDVDDRSGFRTRSILCIPMPDHHGRTIGVVQVLNKRGRAFDDDDASMLATVAAYAGIHIENTKLYLSVVEKNAALEVVRAELEHRVGELDLLVEIERESSQAHNLDELLGRLLGRAILLLDAEAGSIVLRERQTGALLFRTAYGAAADQLRKVRLEAGTGIIGWVADHAQPLMVNDPASDPRHQNQLASELGVPARNLIAVPLLTGSAASENATEDERSSPTLGAFEVLNKRQGSFSDDDQKLLLLIAGQAAKAIVIAEAREERQQSERLASLGQMLSGMLHDFKTPMTIASGYAQLMGLTDNAEQREGYTQLILKQFDLMASMTKEVLAFARGESNLLVRRVYLQKLIAELKAQLERELAGRDVTLVLESRYEGVAMFDEIKMFRLLHNLCRNAVEAMHGSGTLTLRFDKEGDQLLVSVGDTGQGIPEGVEGRLFQPFATEGKEGGTGLGLAIVKKIVDEHQGTISYKTAPGQGTTFFIRLPLQSAAAALAATVD